MRVGDAQLTDQGGQILRPGEGVFFTRKADTAPVIKVDVGEVRDRRMRQLLKGAAALNFITGTHPLDQPPNGLGFTQAAGFAVADGQAAAGTIQRYTGDASPVSPTYEALWLWDGGAFGLSRWVADASLTDVSDSLFARRRRAMFVRTSGSATAAPLHLVHPLPAGVSFAAIFNPYHDIDSNGQPDYDYDGDGDGLPDGQRVAKCRGSGVDF